VEVRSSTDWRREDAAAVNRLIALKSGVRGGGGRRRDPAVGVGTERRFSGERRERELVWAEIDVRVCDPCGRRRGARGQRLGRVEP
jgi:hypothetical protein